MALVVLALAGCTVTSPGPPDARPDGAPSPAAATSDDATPAPDPGDGTTPPPAPPGATSPRGDGAPVVARGRVVDVVDGDTVDLDDGTRVRIAIVDTPEVFGGVEECARAAARFTEAFVLGAEVDVLRPEGAPDVGGFGRLVGEVVRRADGASLNVALYAAGLGRVDERFTAEDPDLTARLRAVTPSDAPCGEVAADAAAEVAPTPAGRGPLVIAAVREDGPGDDVEVFGDSEHLVLRNDGPRDVDLGGWTLVDAAGNRASPPAGFVVRAGGTFRVWSGDGVDVADADWFQDRPQAWLNNSGDTVRLLDPSGAVVDVRTYD